MKKTWATKSWFPKYTKKIKINITQGKNKKQEELISKKDKSMAKIERKYKS